MYVTLGGDFGNSSCKKTAPVKGACLSAKYTATYSLLWIYGEGFSLDLYANRSRQ